MSEPDAPKKIPVTPPIRNVAKKDKAHSIGTVKVIAPPQRVAIKTNIISAKGTEIKTVVTVNMFAIRGSIPEMNWWCAQTKKLKMPVAKVV